MLRTHLWRRLRYPLRVIIYFILGWLEISDSERVVSDVTHSSVEEVEVST
jgi:hypothetical protein